jgi:Xaa-Pro aminopeptidase
VYVRPNDVLASDTYTALPEGERVGIAQALERYRDIGVRIEDAVLITADEPRVLSDGAPRTTQEIESFLAERR